MAQIIAARINQINYVNFKDGVGAEDLHELYDRFCTVSFSDSIQRGAPRLMSIMGTN